MMDPSHQATIYFMHTIGLGMLTNIFAVATGAFLPHPKRRALQSLAIISGSGLEAILGEYGLDYDPNALRATFYWCVSHS